jgi:nucleoside-diphosphate-sugar epimerase
VHIAAPFLMNVEDNERDLLLPAVEGTKNILSAVSSHAPDVTRVVLTSSFAAVVNVFKGPWPEHTYTEVDWNPVEYEASKTGNGALAYCASKVYAERAAFDFVESNKPKFSIATICPPMTYGPLEHAIDSVSKLNTSSMDIYRLMSGYEKDVPQSTLFAFCDVRDVALAYLKAYEVPEAANQRFLVAGGRYSYQMVCDIIRRVIPEIRNKVPEGTPGSGIGMDVYNIDTSKSQKVLGLSYKTLDECITDTAKSLYALEKAGNGASL